MRAQKTSILWLTDTINDFFDTRFSHNGKVYVPGLPVAGSSVIRPNLKQLVTYAWTNPNWKILGGVDAHTTDVKHFSKWPKHGVKGTPGQMQIEETKLPDAVYVPIECVSKEKLESIVNFNEPVYFEKAERSTDVGADASLSPRVNYNVAPALAMIEPRVIVLAGLVLGYCVKEAKDYFVELGYKIAVVSDAVKEFDKSELALLDSWEKEGVLLVKTEDIMQGKLEALV
ncbi:hypothetical protein HY486_02535 [Candidatus Woesearchaeota archaeon]|nr:hypothetical protein [Candidatus Woesearchaeota archaeon]